MGKKSMVWLFGRWATLVALTAVGYPLHAEVVTPESWVSISATTSPLFDNLTVKADAASKGMWSGVYYWPMNGLHAALLPDGKVLTFGTNPDGKDQDGRYYDVWDPKYGVNESAHNTVYDPTRQDSFCAAAAYLPDGSLLISGGNGSTTSNVYDVGSHSSYSDDSNLAAARWYSTMINLPDGRPIILGGMVPYTEDMKDKPDLAVALGLPSMTPEIFENGQWRSLFGAYSRLAFGPEYLRTSYPRAWVAPNGQVFGISADQMWYLDPDANGANGQITALGEFKGPYSYASPKNVGATNSAVMFDVGKILQVGGNGGYNGDELPASNMATVVDINSGLPVLSEQPRMQHLRRYPNTVVLASGDVVVSGGTTYGNYYSGQPAAPVYEVEIWNPKTSSWTRGASAAKYRGYHSITTLLTNGAILSTGGGTPGPVTNLNAEIYYPPYLFKAVAGGSVLAPRPAIKAVSGLSFSSGSVLQLDMTQNAAVSQLVLLGLSSGTHSFNTGQRRIPLTFNQEQFRLTATLPNANLAPPGYYQLVAVDAQGVPSEGVIIALGQNQAVPPVVVAPYTPPSLENAIATPVVNAGIAVTYSPVAQSMTTYSWSFSDTNTSTPYSSSPQITHVFTQPGLYVVTLTAKGADGATSVQTFVQAVSTEKTATPAVTSSPIVVATGGNLGERVWVVNPDNNTVSAIDAVSQSLVAEIPVGISPRAIALAADGRLWVSNKESASISIINPNTYQVEQTIVLPSASQPHGLAISTQTNRAYVVLEATGQLLQFDTNTNTQLSSLTLESMPRYVSISGDGNTLLVTRFISPPVSGEATQSLNTATAGGEVYVVSGSTMTLTKTIKLQYSDKVDSEIQGGGLPNYLAAAAISPDGKSAWIPSKQDNIKRGTLRNGQPLNFQNTVRAISSKVDLASLSEVFSQRIDHDNSGVGAAAVFHPNGVYLFVALETSREVAVVNSLDGVELFRVAVGIAPQGLALSADGKTLYVKEFIDRSVSIVDLTPLIGNGQLRAEVLTRVRTVQNEQLPIKVLKGKALFYDAKDPRLARDSYMSCASCHNDGDQDGRVWDLTGFGEGVRNTIALRGRAAMLHGNLHWSGNFDELQDFEKQIRDLAGGTGLMSDANYFSGTRNQPLGDPKAGLSFDLDNLAAYVASLDSFAASPYRNENGTLTSTAEAGKTVFTSKCESCHGGTTFAVSQQASNLIDIGTLTSASGKRLDGTLIGIDVPTLRDTWATAPYLHNGSASSISAAIQAHNNLALSATDLSRVVAYVQQIGGEEAGNNMAPSAVMSSPLANAQYSAGSDIVISVDAADPDGSISRVEFYYNNILFFTDTAAPYTFTALKVPAGTYSLSAKAYDQFGAVASAAAVVTKVVSGSPNVSPTVSLTSPLPNAIYTEGSNLIVSAAASDSDGTVSKVEFYYNGVLFASDKTAPFSYTVPNAVPGVYSLTAIAYDNDGATTTSAPVSVTVAAQGGGNQAPIVTMTSPLNNSNYNAGANITISADAFDNDGTISAVELYYNGILFFTDKVAPYSFTAVGVPAGTYNLSAKAFDNQGLATMSSVVTVRVGAGGN